MAQYIIASSVGTDEIHLADGTVMTNVAGGAGFYALCGLKMFTDDLCIVSGTDRSYHMRHKCWYDKNNIKTEGLIPRFDGDAITVISYRQEDDRSDEPSVGLEKNREKDPTIDEIKKFLSDKTKAIYTFKHLDILYLKALIQVKHAHGCLLMWEISEDAAVPKNLPIVVKLLKHIDLFSINRKELCALFGNLDFEDALAKLQKLDIQMAFVRKGSDGAVVISPKQKWEIPISRLHKVIDPTGCGNASSAAMLYGITEGYDPQMAGCMGSSAASFILAQFGPPEHIDQAMQQAVLREAEQLCRDGGRE